MGDYTTLIENTSIYNCISEQDEDWEKVANKDKWYDTLIDMATRYEIRIDTKGADKKNIMYNLEDILTDYLGRLLVE